MKAVPKYHVKNTAVTGYSDGVIIMWSFDHGIKLKEWRVTRDTGVILSGIVKTKIASGRHSGVSKRRGLLPVMSRTSAPGASHVKQLLSQYTSEGLLNSDSHAATDTDGEVYEAEQIDDPNPSHNEGTRLPDGSSFVVSSCAVHSEPLVVFGACSDNYIRFWDGETSSLLCSFDALAASNRDGEDRSDEDSIQLLRLSDVENVLIGGYRSGKVCVWTVYAEALLALKSLISGGNSKTLHAQDALVASPLHFVNEWMAHSSSIQSLEFVYFSSDDDDQEELRRAEGVSGNSSIRALNEKYTNALRDDFNPDGFILTSSLDQNTYLWRTDGQFVGEFGGKEWNIFDDTSYSSLSTMDEYSHHPKPPSSTRGSKIRTRPVTLTYLDPVHTNAELHLYVESLKAKNAAKPPPSQEGNLLYKSVASTHPILDLGKLQLKKYMKGETTLDIPMFKSTRKKKES